VLNRRAFSDFSIFISIYFVQNQVGLHSQKTNEQDSQAHNMLSQLPAATDRKVKQQYNWKKLCGTFYRIVCAVQRPAVALAVLERIPDTELFAC